MWNVLCTLTILIILQHPCYCVNWLCEKRNSCKKWYSQFTGIFFLTFLHNKKKNSGIEALKTPLFRLLWRLQITHHSAHSAPPNELPMCSWCSRNKLMQQTPHSVNCAFGFLENTATLNPVLKQTSFWWMGRTLSLAPILRWWSNQQKYRSQSKTVKAFWSTG